MTLTEFLLDRIEADAAAARAPIYGEPLEDFTYASDTQPHHLTCGWRLREQMQTECECNYPARVLAECAAKRRIVELHDYEWMGPDDAAQKGCAHDYEEWPCPTLCHLAAVYKDHPQFENEWIV